MKLQELSKTLATYTGLNEHLLSSSSQCSWWEKLNLDWGIRTLKLSAKFKLFKDFSGIFGWSDCSRSALHSAQSLQTYTGVNKHLLSPSSQCSWWEKLNLDWGIRTLKLSAKCKLFKEFSFHCRSTSLERSCSSFTLAVKTNKQSNVVNFHSNFKMFLALKLTGSNRALLFVICNWCLWQNISKPDHVFGGLPHSFEDSWH